MSPSATSDVDAEVDEVLDRALRVWGREAQIEKALEEIRELEEVLVEELEDGADYYDLVEELADVRIITRQLVLMYGEEWVDETRERKIERLNRRLDEAEGSP